MCVLEQRRLRGEKAAQGVTILLVWLLPVSLNRIEGFRDAFKIGVAILGNKSP
jgi:hypothetical protein